MRVQLEKLEDRFVNAKTDAERKAIHEEIQALCDLDASAVAKAALEGIRAANTEAAEVVLREKIKTVLPAISISYLAKTYFRRSPQWFYQRLNGNAVNGKPARFTGAELQTLHAALIDISGKINASASVVF